MFRNGFVRVFLTIYLLRYQCYPYTVINSDWTIGWRQREEIYTNKNKATYAVHCWHYLYLHNMNQQYLLVLCVNYGLTYKMMLHCTIYDLLHYCDGEQSDDNVFLTRWNNCCLFTALMFIESPTSKTVDRYFTFAR